MIAPLVAEEESEAGTELSDRDSDAKGGMDPLYTTGVAAIMPRPIGLDQLIC